MTTQREQTVRKALLQKKVGDDGVVRCLTCERRCLLSPDKVGWCHTRVNRSGKIYTLVYGLISSLSVNPIEKKPFFHFHPGSIALTAGTWSCNFACPWCQNWELARSLPKKARNGYGFVPPREFIALARRYRCLGTSISFSEPTLLLEWSSDVFQLARKEGLYNTFVTNGYMTKEALELLAEAGLDAANVDIKGDTDAVRRYCQADVEVIWRNCRLLKEKGIHLEVTTLVIPGVNDDGAILRPIAERIRAELGSKTPWHLTTYFPAYRFHAPPTPLATLERAHALGKQAGLEYVYLGNVPGHRFENTYCPNCGALLIERQGFSITTRLSKRYCPGCGEQIPLIIR